MQKFQVNERENGTSLEKYVRKVLNVAPLSFIYRLFRKKDIKVNGHWEDRKFIIHSNDEVTIYITDEQLEELHKKKEITPNKTLLKFILYEDDQILLINKPRGILVQRDGKETAKSLDILVAEYEMSKEENNNNINVIVPSLAHRLDRNTSGLLAFGKTHESITQLHSLFKERNSIEKHYLALVKGQVNKDGVIDVPLFKDETNTVRTTSIEKGGKSAKTIYKVIETFGEYTLLDLTLVTGRTHQIRVHLSYLGYPVIGDSKYGDFKTNAYFEKEYGLKNQFLHASEMRFGQLQPPLDYLSNRKFAAPMPEEFETIIMKLKEKHTNEH